MAMPPFFPPPARQARVSRCWMLQVTEPFRVAVLMRGDPSVRYAVLNAAGQMYLEFDQPRRLHYVEHLCTGNLQLAEMKPIRVHRDAARALVGDPQWELGEWTAGGQGSRSDLIPFYRVPVQELASDAE